MENIRIRLLNVTAMRPFRRLTLEFVRDQTVYCAATDTGKDITLRRYSRRSSPGTAGISYPLRLT